MIYFCRKIISNRSDKFYVKTFHKMDVNNQGCLGLGELEKANLVSGAGLKS